MTGTSTHFTLRRLSLTSISVLIMAPSLSGRAICSLSCLKILKAQSMSFTPSWNRMFTSVRQPRALNLRPRWSWRSLR
ncbi:hypothetical protein D3C86_1978260 [compost metagenome]